MNLADTDVLVDCLRGTGPTRGRLQEHAEQTFALPAVAAMELAMGGRNRDELGTFPVAWPEASEFAAAYDLLLTHRLASALNIPDCLIAVTALSRSARLYTFNL